MATYLVTGGAGFIGSHIVERLVELGHNVKVLDNLIAGNMENLSSVIDKIEFIDGDIRNLELLKEITKGVDYILHQAALRSVPKSVENPLEYDEVNVHGTLNVFVAARDNGVKRVVYASSSSVYGDQPQLPEREDMLPLLVSPYAASKLANEYYARCFYYNYGLETVGLRYFNVFGPKQSLDNQYAVVIPKFITSILKDEPPPIHGDGSQTRDFTYIDNVVDGNLLACEKEGIAGEVFNLACGQSCSVLDLVKYINEILGKDVKPVFTPPRPGDVKHTLADITKVKEKMGFNCKVDLMEGLRRTVKWFKERV